MNLNRFLAFFASLVMLAGAFWADLNYLLWLGFRDHYITDLGHAEGMLARIFIGLSLIQALHFVWLGIVAGRRNVGRHLAIAVAFYLVMLAIAAAVDFYLRTHLDGGQGG